MKVSSSKAIISGALHKPSWSHQVDVTQAAEPEGVEAGGDGVQLVGLEGLFTLQHGAV